MGFIPAKILVGFGGSETAGDVVGLLVMKERTGFCAAVSDFGVAISVFGGCWVEDMGNETVVSGLPNRPVAGAALVANVGAVTELGAVTTGAAAKLVLDCGTAGGGAEPIAATGGLGALGTAVGSTGAEDWLCGNAPVAGAAKPPIATDG